MQQTFKKLINGHLLQFNRLLFPLRYAVKLDDLGSPGDSVTLTSFEKEWRLSEETHLSDWVGESLDGIIQTIKDNEEGNLRLD